MTLPIAYERTPGMDLMVSVSNLIWMLRRTFQNKQARSIVFWSFARGSVVFVLLLAVMTFGLTSLLESAGGYHCQVLQDEVRQWLCYANVAQAGYYYGLFAAVPSAAAGIAAGCKRARRSGSLSYSLDTKLKKLRRHCLIAAIAGGYLWLVAFCVAGAFSPW